jgi:alkylhydroperoxidase family enzyme
MSERGEPGIPASSEPREPRITPLPRDEWTDEVFQGIAALMPAGVDRPLRRRKGGSKGHNVLGTLARHPQLMRAYHTFNGHILFTSSLDARQRELLILRVAALREATYEWEQHVVLAEEAGISEQEIARIADGPDAPGWSVEDAAMLRAVDELVVDAMITDATWAALSETMDEHQLMDLVFTVGAYDLLAMAFRSFRVQLDDDLRPDAP